MRSAVLQVSFLLVTLGFAEQGQSQVVLRLSSKEPTSDMIGVGSEVWYGGENEITCWKDYRTTTWPSDMEVTSLVEVKGAIWAGTRRGLVKLTAGRLEPLPGLWDGKRGVTALRRYGKKVLIGTRDGLYLSDFDGSGSQVLAGQVHLIRVIGSDLWIATTKHLYRIQSDLSTISQFFDVETRVSEVVLAQGAYWILTDRDEKGQGPVHRLDDLSGSPIELNSINSGYRVYGVTEFERRVWLATHNGVVRLEGDEPVPQEGVEGIVNFIGSHSGKLWVSTETGVYTWDSKFLAVIEMPPETPLHLASFKVIDGEPWMWGRSGLYRFDSNIVIQEDLNTARLWNLELLWGRKVSLDSVRYMKRLEETQLAADIPIAFDAIFRIDRKEFREDLAERRFAPVEVLDHKHLKWGPNKV